MLRRHFIQLSATTFAAAIFAKLTYAKGDFKDMMKFPDGAWAQLNDQWVKLTTSNGSLFTHKEISVEIRNESGRQSVFVHSPVSDLQGIRLNWKHETPLQAKVLGDHWERGYGDLAWKAAAISEKKPWYMLINDGKQTSCFGVKTGANSICYWTVDQTSLALTMDTHSGGVGVKLGSRKLHTADIVTMMSKESENPYLTTARFCKMMCDQPLLPKLPVYGINDWYVVYGNNSASSIKRQTAVMAELVTNSNNRPFSVIDDGWQISDDFSIANEKFKDMHHVADEIKELGMRPGLWTRPLIAKRTDSVNMLAPIISGRNQTGEPILDPTIPETLERVKYNIALYKKWGYEMVKHDYSTYDIFGRWGFKMTDTFTQTGWKFYDQTKTNAEIISRLYRTISKAADGMYIIGCNTISHLSAGLFEINRTGDDTSGKEWARTKKMGVNTLGFRLAQHNTFYAADGDCVGLTKDVPWEKNRQWLQLLAESGSPLFISAQTDFLDAEKRAAIKLAFAQAASVQSTGEPLDWMDNAYPSKWRLNNREVNFEWD